MHRVRLLSALLFAVALLVVPAARSASSDMVVSQVYGGGGNSGATYANDFVELFNRGAAAVDLGTWSVQYASATGTSWQVTPLTGSVQPGRYFLVQLASAAAVGAALPTADATGTTNLANSGGKVAVVRTTTALACGGSAGSCSADTNVVDLVGYGSATDFEGSDGAPALGNTTSDVRGAGGCTDTDANDSDFTGATPTPRNSATVNGLVRWRSATGGDGVVECRRGHRHRGCPLDLSREAEHQLRERTGGREPGCSLRARYRLEHQRGRLCAHRSSLGIPASRPSSRHDGHGAEQRADRPSVGGRGEGRHPDRARTRPADRYRLHPQWYGWGRLADQRQLRLGAPGGAAGALHGDRHLHGGRPMIGAALRGAGLAALLLLAPASAGASGARPPVALTASPAHRRTRGIGADLGPGDELG